MRTLSRFFLRGIWKKLTGKTADQLGDEWKAALKANNGYAFPKNEANAR